MLPAYLSVSNAIARFSTLFARSFSARSRLKAVAQSAWNGTRQLSPLERSNFIPLSIKRYSTSSVVRVRSLMEWPTSSSHDDWPSIWKRNKRQTDSVSSNSVKHSAYSFYFCRLNMVAIITEVHYFSSTCREWIFTVQVSPATGPHHHLHSEACTASSKGFPKNKKIIELKYIK